MGSIPCTGGSPWQYVNEAHYFRTGNHRALRRLRGVRTDFRYLLGNFVKLAHAVKKAGGIVCLEWPSQCQYWRDPQVKTFVRELALFNTVLHGCAYGLRNRKGDFMKKALDDCIHV